MVERGRHVQIPNVEGGGILELVSWIGASLTLRLSRVSIELAFLVLQVRSQHS